MLPLQKTPPAREASTCSNWSKLLSINRLHLPQPDLNEEPQRDEIHHLHKDQVHLQEGNEVHQLQGQVQYLYEGEHNAVHAIDLNIPACEGQQQDPDTGNVSLNSILTSPCCWGHSIAYPCPSLL